MNDEQWRIRSAWRGATAAVVLNLVGMPLDLVIARGVPGVPIWPNLVDIGMAATLLVGLLYLRGRPSLRTSHVLFFANVLAIIVALWFTNSAYAESERPWVPFQGNKLGVVTISLLAPELWVGATCILGYVAAALLQMSLLSPTAWSHFAIGEPWATLAFGAFSGLLLAYRLKRSALEREVARAQAELETTRKFARVLLAARDLSNTPLQTIAFAAARAKTVHPDLEPTMGLVERSVQKLCRLNDRLREHEAALRWTEDESFDSEQRLSFEKPALG
jgi:hypothetical protein